MRIKRDTEYLKKVGGSIKAARMDRKLSVRKLAELCLLDYSCLNRAENGQYSIRVLTLKRIADSMGMDAKNFL
jgi:hypothetical protein